MSNARDFDILSLRTDLVRNRPDVVFGRDGWIHCDWSRETRAEVPNPEKLLKEFEELARPTWNDLIGLVRDYPDVQPSKLWRLLLDTANAGVIRYASEQVTTFVKRFGVLELVEGCDTSVPLEDYRAVMEMTDEERRELYLRGEEIARRAAGLFPPTVGEVPDYRYSHSRMVTTCLAWSKLVGAQSNWPYTPHRPPSIDKTEPPSWDQRVEWYWHFASKVRVIRELSADLCSTKPSKPEFWAIMWNERVDRLEETWAFWADKLDLQRPTKTGTWDRPSNRRRVLELEINVSWLEEHAVVPYFRWKRNKPELILSSGRGGLFGDIALGLALTLMRGDDKHTVQCHHCRKLYQSPRKPRRDRERHFCQECQDSGKPQMYAQRDYRERLREKTAGIKKKRRH
jgi:hypothetical protein